MGSTKNCDVWLNFYDKMKGVKEHHRKNYFAGSNSAESHDVEFYYNLALSQDDTDMMFSGEEKGGSRVDLGENFTQFMNLKKLRDFRKQHWKAGVLARLKRKDPKANEDSEAFQTELANYQVSNLN